MKRLTVLLILIALLMSSCSNATLDSAGKELEDAIENVVDSNNKYVLMVKGGYRASDPSVTYEEAFSAFFGTPRWNYFKGEDGQDIVEFTGNCIYRDVSVKARIQFVVDKENGTFEATYLAFNEVPQDALTLAAVIAKAFEEVQGSVEPSIDNSSASNADQVLLNGIPVQTVMEMSENEVVQAFGEPELNLDCYIEYRVDAPKWLDITFGSDGKVDYISGDPANFTSQGQSLYQEQDVIIGLFGDDYQNLGGTAYGVQYQWVVDGCCFVFSFPMVADSAGKFMSYSIEVYREDTGTGTGNDPAALELLFNRSPARQWLGASIDTIMDQWGSPLHYSDYEWEGGYEKYCQYDGIEFGFDENRAISSISMLPAACTYNGSALERNRSDLISILGSPTQEGWEDYGYDYETNEFIKRYFMIYETFDGGISVKIEFLSPDDAAYRIYIS